MNILMIIIDLITTATLYMAYPFWRFSGKDTKCTKKNLITTLILNSIIVKIFFIILNCIIFKNYQLDNNFAPAVTYYFINYLIWKRKIDINIIPKMKKNETEDEFEKNTDFEKELKMKSKYRTITTIVICITAIIVISTTFYFLYQKENMKQQIETERLEKEEENRSYYRRKLSECIDDAETIRNDLWKANCPENNPNCSLATNTVNWIDSRYKQEIEECKLKWNYD